MLILGNVSKTRWKQSYENDWNMFIRGFFLTQGKVIIIVARIIITFRTLFFVISGAGLTFQIQKSGISFRKLSMTMSINFISTIFIKMFK